MNTDTRADFEHFIQEAIDRGPEPLRRLGEYLSKVLDEDQWKTAERMLIGVAEAYSAKNDAGVLQPICPECGKEGAHWEQTESEGYVRGFWTCKSFASRHWIEQATGEPK